MSDGGEQAQHHPRHSISGHDARGPLASHSDELYEEFVLDLGGDDQGVWELVWLANTLFLGSPSSEIYALAADILDRALATGMVELTCDGAVVDRSALPSLDAIAPLATTDQTADTRWWLRAIDLETFREGVVRPLFV
jgi:hypothetical protein